MSGLRFVFQMGLRGLVCVLLVTGCVRKANVNAEGFGGGGQVDSAVLRIASYLEQAKERGVPHSLCKPVAQCEKQVSPRQCYVVNSYGGNEAKSARCRNFLSQHIDQYINIAKSTPIIVVNEPIYMNMPNGEKRSVDAMVPQGRREVWVRESVLAGGDIQDLQALLVHEYSHLIEENGRRFGDFDSIGEFDEARFFFDFIGGGIVVDQVVGDNPYRREVLKDSPLVYLSLDDRLGSKNALDVSGNNLKGTFIGDLSFEQPTLPRFGASVEFLPSSSIRIDLPQFPTSPVTIEFWFKLRTYNRDYASIVMFAGGPRLVIKDNVMGFSTGAGHVVGSDVSNLDNRWVHIAAKFDNVDWTKNELYIDGIRRVFDHTIGTAVPFANPVETLIIVNGVGAPMGMDLIASYDELAVHASPLSGERIKAHFAKTETQPAQPVSDIGIIGQIEDVGTIAAFDEFTCYGFAQNTCIYEIGVSTLNSVSNFIGSVSVPVEFAGKNKKQGFKFNNLEVGKRYDFTVFPFVVTEETPYFAALGEGEGTVVMNPVKTFPNQYYPGRWHIAFVADKPTVTLLLYNQSTTGSNYMVFDAFSLLPP